VLQKETLYVRNSITYNWSKVYTNSHLVMFT